MTIRYNSSHNWYLIDKSGNRLTDRVFDYAKWLRKDRICIRNGDRWGLYDLCADRILLDPQFEELREFDIDDVGIAMSDGKWGMLQPDGHRIGEWNLDYLGFMSCGLAIGQIGDKHGYVDACGNWQIPCVFRFAEPFFEERAVCSDGTGRWRYIDLTGAQVGKATYVKANSFSEGRAFVRAEDFSGLIDPDLRVICHLAFDKVFSFREGLATYCLDVESNRHGFIGRNGQVAFPLVVDESDVFSEGFCAVKMDGKWGAINHHGDLVIPAEFDQIGRCGNGLVPVERDGKSGYVTKDGQTAIPLQFDIALPFRDGAAAVAIAKQVD